MSNKKIGIYELTRLLGRGGMGEVWLARDTVLRRNVALKLLPIAMLEKPSAAKRFLREARTAAQLNHPNGVTIYQVGEEAGHFYIAMELVEGGNLSEEVKRRGALPWVEATRAIRGAAAALAAAHESGLVHRDIKPSNLMRTSQGFVKVVDFGLARAVSESAELTHAGAVLGTPAYMAPEQGRGEKVDARTDIYSLACTYFVLVTGKLPFRGNTSTAVIYQHVHEPCPDPQNLMPDLPTIVCEIIAKGMAKAASDRYQSAAEMIGDLDEALADATAPGTMPAALRELARAVTKSTRETPSTVVVGKQSRQKRPSRWLITAIVGGAAILLVALAIVIWQHGNNSQGPTSSIGPDSTAQQSSLPIPSKSAEAKADAKTGSAAAPSTSPSESTAAGEMAPPPALAPLAGTVGANGNSAEKITAHLEAAKALALQENYKQAFDEVEIALALNGKDETANALRSDLLRRDVDGTIILSRVIPQYKCHTLGGAVDAIRELSGASTFVNWAALQEAGVTKDSGVEIDSTGLQVQSLLHFICDQVSTNKQKVSFDVIGGVIQLSTADALDLNTSTCVYGVRDLIGASDQDLKNLISLIESTVSPRSWADSGGTIGSIKSLDGSLIIQQNHRNQKQIEALLRQLRQGSHPPKADAGPGLPYQADFEPSVFHIGSLLGQDGWTSVDFCKAAKIVSSGQDQQIDISGLDIKPQDPNWYNGTFIKPISCDPLKAGTRRVSVHADVQLSLGPGASRAKIHGHS